MSVEVVARISAVLALLAGAYAVAGVTLMIAARRSGRARTLWDRLVGPSQWLAVAIPAGATAGSLWFSEVAGFVPCELCWWQRIAMYPLTAVTLVGVLRRDRGLLWTVAPLAGTGFTISVWHWLVERVPSLSDTTSCSATVPCTVPWFTQFGFVTLAFMAACGFAGTVVAVTLARPWSPR
jgi:disulfide bond formation protein DsbB